MIYFHLNNESFIEPLVDGEQFALGEVNLYFFNDVFSRLSKAEVYEGLCPYLKDVSTNYQKTYLAIIDEETTNSSIEEIYLMMEKAQSKIIPRFGMSLAQMGLRYDFVSYLSNREARNAQSNYLAENNLMPLYEEIGNRNMSLNEKIIFMSKQLLQIGSENNELIIADAYIFPKRHNNDYKDLFVGIAHATKVTSIKIFTKSINKELQTSIEEAIGIPITVTTCEQLHDRWWLLESLKKGVACGFSLNGLGGKNLATVNEMPRADVEKVLKDLAQIGLPK
jgi:hypothetical protein